MLARNIVPVGLLAVTAASVPYILGYALEFRHSIGLLTDVPTDSWSWQILVAEALHYFLSVCLDAVIAIGLYRMLQGHRLGTWALIRPGLARLPSLLGVVVVVAVPGALTGLVGSTLTNGPELSMPATGLLTVALIVLLAPLIFLFVAVPVAAVEGLSPVRCIARSFNLVRSCFLRIVGLVLALLLVMFVAVFAILSLELTGVEFTSEHYRVMVWPDLLLASFYTALWAVACTVAYRDLRVSQEGTDPMTPTGARSNRQSPDPARRTPRPSRRSSPVPQFEPARGTAEGRRHKCRGERYAVDKHPSPRPVRAALAHSPKPCRTRSRWLAVALATLASTAIGTAGELGPFAALDWRDGVTTSRSGYAIWISVPSTAHRATLPPYEKPRHTTHTLGGARRELPGPGRRPPRRLPAPGRNRRDLPRQPPGLPGRLHRLPPDALDPRARGTRRRTNSGAR